MNIHKESLKQNKSFTFMLNLFIQYHNQTRNLLIFEPLHTIQGNMGDHVILEG